MSNYIKNIGKIYLSLFLTGLVLVSGFCLSSCSDDSEKEIENEISINDLPSAAQDFLHKYFYGVEVSKIEQEIAGEIMVYVVDLENGFEVVFNEEGEWQEVDSPYGETIPEAIIPEQVYQTLQERFPGYGVLEINTTGEGWKVELSDNQGGSAINLYFNMSGQIINTTDLN